MLFMHIASAYIRRLGIGLRIWETAMKWTAFAVVLTLLGGPVGAQTTTQTTAQTNEVFSGIWSGRVDQPDIEAYDVAIEFFDDFATVLYAGLDCAGVLEVIEGGVGQRNFAEHIIIGRETEGGECVEDGTVSLDARSGFIIYRWFWPDGELGATAKLTRDAGAR